VLMIVAALWQGGSGAGKDIQAVSRRGGRTFQPYPRRRPVSLPSGAVFTRRTGFQIERCLWRHRSSVKVLVPGAGLGRMALEFAQRGIVLIDLGYRIDSLLCGQSPISKASPLKATNLALIC
jgi:hypothetical protein